MWPPQAVSIVLTALALSQTVSTTLPSKTGVSVFVRTGSEKLQALRKETNSLPPGVFTNHQPTELHIVADIFISGTPKLLKVSPTSLAGLASVKKVVLMTVQMDGPSPSPFSNFTSLRELILDNNAFKEFPKHFCARIPTLKVLSINQQEIVSLTGDSFTTIPKELEVLRIDNCKMSSIAPRSFERFSQLNILSLYGNHLSTMGDDTLAGLSKLTVLNLYGNRLTDIEAGAFADLTNVQGINLRRNRLKTLPEGLFDDLPMLDELLLDEDIRGNGSYLGGQQICGGVQKKRKCGAGSKNCPQCNWM